MFVYNQSRDGAFVLHNNNNISSRRGVSTANNINFDVTKPETFVEKSKKCNYDTWGWNFFWIR